MVQRGLILAAMILASLSLGSRCFGAEPSMEEVMKRLSAMEDKNKDLERQVKEAQSKNRNVAFDNALKASDAKISSVVTDADPVGCRPLKIGGYLDVSYEYNFNKPNSQINGNRVFDTDANGFNVHLMELNFERLPTKPGEAGFRIDTDFGTDPRTFLAQDATAVSNQSFGPGFSANPGSRGLQAEVVDLQQAYIEYVIPIGSCDRGITMDFGKFVTWAGAETIEASDNINASRSLLFGYAIPFTHTGIRATYDIFTGGECGGKWTVGAGIVNGWDNIQDQNRPKTFLFESNWTPTKWFNWVFDGIAGHEGNVDQRVLFASAGNIASQNAGNGAPDPTPGRFFVTPSDDPATPGAVALNQGKNFSSSDGRMRYLADTTITLTPWDAWTFAVNADYGREGRIPRALLTQATRNPVWWGFAGYVKYQINKNWYVANRTEYFRDKKGTRLPAGLDQHAWETTLTLDWMMADPMHMRFEYRHDHSNVGAFNNTNINSTNIHAPGNIQNQDTVMVQWLYKF